MLRKPNKTKNITDEEEDLAIGFWQSVCKNMKDWQLASEKSISTFELRRDYIHAHALAVHVIGRLGADLLSIPGKNYKKELKNLQKVDWSRKNSALWEGRAMIGGKINKSHNSVILTTNYLKKVFNIQLTPEEQKVESAFLAKA